MYFGEKKKAVAVVMQSGPEVSPCLEQTEMVTPNIWQMCFLKAEFALMFSCGARRVKHLEILSQYLFSSLFQWKKK